MKFKDALPEFYAEVFALLTKHAVELVQQMPDLNITGRCKCAQFDCSTFSVEGGTSPFSREEQEERGKYETNSIDLDASVGLVVVDFDYLQRIKSFEVLNRDDVHEKLGKLFQNAD